MTLLEFPTAAALASYQAKSTETKHLWYYSFDSLQIIAHKGTVDVQTSEALKWQLHLATVVLVRTVNTVSLTASNLSVKGLEALQCLSCEIFC